MIRGALSLVAIVLLLSGVLAQERPPSPTPSSLAFVNGRWFDGKTFQPRTLYAVDGLFTTTAPAKVDRTVELTGLWMVPPYGEAHNHNIDGASEARSVAALRRYGTDGVFYVKIQGNYPLSDDLRSRLPMNAPGRVDVRLAQAFLTASGGHPIPLHENVLMRQGYYGTLDRSMLRDRLYFALDTEADVERNWASILQLRPDFIKANLWASDEHATRRDDPAFAGRRALSPAVLAAIVAKARTARLPVSVHVTTAADFHNAVIAGVDEIVHLPLGGPFPGDGAPSPLADADIRLAADRGTVVVTTAALLARSQQKLPDGSVIGRDDVERAKAREVQLSALQRLRAAGVRLAVGSDNPADTSIGEFEYLSKLGVLAPAALLDLWTNATPRAIFPGRKIGVFDAGYEASFLALEGDPLVDLQNVRRIQMRWKQGVLVEAAPRPVAP